MGKGDRGTALQEPLLGPGSPTNHNDQFARTLTRSLEDIQKSLERQSNEDGLRFGMTPVRRMFCLLSLFDFLLAFLLWIIYAQLSNFKDITEAFKIEVEKYKFGHSLFDFVAVAFLRGLLLLFVYGLFKSSKWYMVALSCPVIISADMSTTNRTGRKILQFTTMLSTLLAIIKVCLYGSTIAKGQPMSYFIIIATFVICWSEAWHFDFQVIPTELRTRRENLSNVFTGSIPTLPSTISNWRQGPLSEYQSCYSPNARSPQESESDSDLMSEYSVDVKDSKSKNKQFEHQGKEAVKEVLKILHISENWKKEKEEKDGIVVEARTFEKVGKVYRCHSLIDCNASLLLNILWTNVESQPSWNPTVSDCQIISVINKKTDLCYVVAAEAAAGLVSSRDFVTVRRFEKHGNLCILGGVSTICESIPERNNIVRGENGPGGYVIKAIPEDPDHCEFIWFLNTNIKGWIPQKVIDQTMASVIVDTVRALRHHVASMPKL